MLRVFGSCVVFFFYFVLRFCVKGAIQGKAKYLNLHPRHCVWSHASFTLIIALAFCVFFSALYLHHLIFIFILKMENDYIYSYLFYWNFIFVIKTRLIVFFWFISYFLLFRIAMELQVSPNLWSFLHIHGCVSMACRAAAHAFIFFSPRATRAGNRFCLPVLSHSRPRIKHTRNYEF